MLLDKDQVLQFADFEELFPPTAQEQDLKTASDVLHSELIRIFEQSIEEGMSPIEALTTILGWVSCEMARINVAEGSARTKLYGK